MGLVGTAIRTAKGEFGHVAAGAMLGAMAGGAYGGMSRDGSVVGGAIGGAMLGGLAGAGLLAARSAHAGYAATAEQAAIFAAGAGQEVAASAWGTAKQAMHVAGVKEGQQMRNLAETAGGFISNTYTKGLNKIDSFAAGRTGRAMASQDAHVAARVKDMALNPNGYKTAHVSKGFGGRPKIKERFDHRFQRFLTGRSINTQHRMKSTLKSSLKPRTKASKWFSK